MNGADICVPYCVEGFTCDAKGAVTARGPYNTGVLCSADSGRNWQIERVSNLDASFLTVCKTEDFYYYFAASLAEKSGQGYELWFARKSANGGPWGTPKVVAGSFSNFALDALTEGGTVHLCWLDRRHEKKRFNLVYQQRQNHEVVYSHRKDSDVSWSQDNILSAGLLYSYAPSISVECDKIVVAWAGIQTAPDWHNEYSPNDIYYVTSKDGGKTWTKPLKVTDGAKDGITSGKPQVALKNRVIHLFYIQGKMNLKQQSPGLTKLNQPPWPIYYQQRSFPN
jgi:hypothetical protein